MPKYLYSSTLFYSGIFAAATTFDAAHKKRRREQWDRAISDLRQEVGQPVKDGEELLLQQSAKEIVERSAPFRPFGLGKDASDARTGEAFENRDMLPFEQLEAAGDIATGVVVPARSRRQHEPYIPDDVQKKAEAIRLAREKATMASAHGRPGTDTDSGGPVNHPQTNVSAGLIAAAYRPFGLEEYSGPHSDTLDEPERHLPTSRTLERRHDQVPMEMEAKSHSGDNDAEVEGEDSFEAYRPFRDVEPDAPPPQWPTNTGRGLDQHLLPPQSIYATWTRQFTAQERLWSQKKLANVNNSMEVLLYRMLCDIHVRGGLKEASEAVPAQFAEALAQGHDQLRMRQSIYEQRLLTLKHITVDEQIEEYIRADAELPERQDDLCRYTHNNLHGNDTIRVNLDRSLRYLFNECRHKRIGVPTLLAKISHNLHTSLVPPDVRTYNTLLLGFTVLEEYDIASWVIQSMHETHMRFNEVSFAAILDYYKNSNQPDAFIDTIKWMRGENGGPMLAHPHTWFTDSKRDLLMQKPGAPWKIIQLPYPTPFVFNAILRGIMKFAGLDTAIATCQRMRKDGWGVSMDGFGILLQACAERSDWDAGQAVWKNILALKERSRKRYGSVWTAEKIGLGPFASMLRLCLRCKRREDYDEVWEMANKSHTLPGLAEKLIARISKEENIEVNGYAAAAEHMKDLSSDVRSLLEAEQGGDGSRAEEEPGADMQHAGQPAADERMSSDHHNDQSRADRPHDDPTASLPRPGKSAPLNQDQLLGHLQGSNELDDYEAGERPMTLRC